VAPAAVLVSALAAWGGSVQADEGIAYHDLRDRAISAWQEVDTFTFAGQVGDVVLIRVNRTAGELNPLVRLYRPDGSLLAEAGPLWSAYDRTEILDQALPQGGSYRLCVADDDGLQWGDYAVTLECVNRPTGAETAAYDDVRSDTLTAVPEIKLYRFSGLAGDRVILRANRTAGELNPHLRLYRPDGSLQATADPMWSAYERTELFDQGLTQNGTYTVCVIDDDGFQLGELAFTLQCVNRPVGAEDMVYHGLVSATISAVPEMELYRFSGQIGDRVVLRVNRSSGELNPHLRLYRPDGGLVAEAGPVWPGNDRTELFDQSLLQTGQYTVYVSDDDGSQLGEFALTVECVNRPLGAKAVVYDDLLEDTLETAPRFRLYRFEGQIGDRAIFRVNRTSGEVNPCVRVYRPDGSLLAEAGPLWPNYERAELFDLNLSQTGTHTLLVADEDGYQLGQYHVTLQCVNRPVGAVTAGYGELVSGQVADVPEMYLFRFDGAVGEQVCIRLNRTSGDLNPWVRLYRPDGSLLAEAGPLWPGYERTELYDQLLSQTGTYTLYVSDEDGYQTGSYAMMLECINDPGEVYPAAYNDLIADTVDAVPRWHVYRFAGQSGDRLIVRANRISGEVNPWIRIYRPDGSLLADAGPMWPSYDRAELYDVTLNFSGTYTLYVSDEDGYQMGEYGVTLQCVNRPIGAGTMAFGDVAAEVIDSFPRIRLHRFLATVGDRVVIQASRVSGDVVSWVRLYDPSGNVVTEGQSDGAVTICAALIPATGQQTIYLSDDDGFGLGTDTLRLLEFKCGDVNTMSGPAAINVSDITYLIAWTFRGGPPPMCLQAADVTNDGGFTVADLTYLISYLFRGGPAPAC